MIGLGTGMQTSQEGLFRSITGLPGAPIQGGGVTPSLGYFFLQGKNVDGSYSTLTGLNADASRSNLQGKAA